MRRWKVTVMVVAEDEVAAEAVSGLVQHLIATKFSPPSLRAKIKQVEVMEE